MSLNHPRGNLQSLFVTEHLSSIAKSYQDAFDPMRKMGANIVNANKQFVSLESNMLKALKSMQSAEYGAINQIQKAFNTLKINHNDFRQPFLLATETLLTLSDHNRKLINSLAAAQTKLTSNMVTIQNAFHPPKLVDQNILKAVTTGLSLNVLDKLKHLDWDGIEEEKLITDKLNSVSSSITDGEINNEQYDLLVEILNKIEASLNFLKNATTTQESLFSYNRIFAYLTFIMTIVFFLINKYSSDNATKDQLKVAEINRGKIDSLNDKVESIYQIFEETNPRVCGHTTKIHKRPRPKSIALGLVKKGQIVNVVQIDKNKQRKKWIYVTYIDFEFETPMSGWVLKKYFKKVD